MNFSHKNDRIGKSLFAIDTSSFLRSFKKKNYVLSKTKQLLKERTENCTLDLNNTNNYTKKKKN